MMLHYGGWRWSAIDVTRVLQPVHVLLHKWLVLCCGYGGDGVVADGDDVAHGVAGDTGVGDAADYVSDGGSDSCGCNSSDDGGGRISVTGKRVAIVNRQYH